MKYFDHPDVFESRHIGPDNDEINEMVKDCGANTLDQLIDEIVPKNIRLKNKLNLDEPLSESEFIKRINFLASKNKIYKSYIGMGYNPTITSNRNPEKHFRKSRLVHAIYTLSSRNCTG